jgi:hypothetical protein
MFGRNVLAMLLELEEERRKLGSGRLGTGYSGLETKLAISLLGSTNRLLFSLSGIMDGEFLRRVCFVGERFSRC